MAITTLESNMVTRAMAAAKLLLQTIKPELDALDVLYNGAGGGSTSITQQDLDGVASFSGLTKQQLDDALFVLTGACRTPLSTSFTQLEQLAARA